MSTLNGLAVKTHQPESKPSAMAQEYLRLKAIRDEGLPHWTHEEAQVNGEVLAWVWGEVPEAERSEMAAPEAA